MSAPDIEIRLNAVIIAVTEDAPRVLTVPGQNGYLALPTGLLQAQDRTLDTALRRWVADQTGLDVGYVEQLYTFGDLGRSLPHHVTDNDDRTKPSSDQKRILSIAYLALVKEGQTSESAAWQDVYDFLPWEDHRPARPEVIDSHIRVGLDEHLARVDAAQTESTLQRSQIMFGFNNSPYDGVRVLERYELLYEAGLLEEKDRASSNRHTLPPSKAMSLDHRRILATAFGRLRGKITYRPVVFELLPDVFTLLQLQRVVEALAGVQLHKQNFRRLVESAGLVEGTGMHAQNRGRPAELFRFRREVLRERPRPGVGAPWARN